MLPAIRLLPISLLLAAALAPVSARAGADLDKIVAQMLVGKDGARTDIIRNPQARTLEVRTMGFDGEIMRKDVFRLNAAGDPIACQIFDGRGNLLYRVLFAFDNMGRKKVEATYNKAGKMVRRAVFSYDANGKQLRPEVQTFADANRQPIAPMAPQLTPQGRLAQPMPGPAAPPKRR